MSNTLQAVRGMNDVLPQEAQRWDFLEQTVRAWAASYGYQAIRTPILEQTGLFKRAIGEVTDIVEKEMYTFIDELNGESLTLRPEGTASCVRAAIQHNLLYDGPKRLWYMGPMFRHERPQKGRYRQFHQVGVEAFGYADADCDAELILMGADLWRRLGLDPRLEINTLGDGEGRKRHRERLIAYFESHADVLDEDARRRLHSNPLRILDSKNPAMQALIAAAPKLVDDLDEDSLKHFEGLQALLRAAHIPYVINPRLVRGLDYYNRTVFEWVTDTLGAQGTVCAGGRYDGLVAQLGGKPAPAAGFALGVERVLAMLEGSDRTSLAAGPHGYLVHVGDVAAAWAWELAPQLRAAGLNIVYHCGGGGFKAQMKKADASGARYAIIIGDDEAQSRELTLKPLRDPRAQARLTPDAAITLMEQD